jgi:ABC-2 type transport system ATP-binding protein
VTKAIENPPRAGETPPGAGGGAAIETHGLTKRFGDLVAVDGLDLRVPYGSIFGFLGPNGAGKTTTLRMLTGLGWPTSGTAIVDGVPVARGDARLAARIGYLDQDPRFYAWMTGRELLQLAGRAYGLEGEPLRARVDETLEIVGLAEAGHRRIGGYSGGMRQRLGVGQAILPRPQVLFLDEPVSALDPAGRRDILELIGSLRGVTTVVMSTHILNDVERICDRIAILDRGRLVTEAPIEELLARHARPVLEIDPEPGQDAAVAAIITTLQEAGWTRTVREQHGMVRVTVGDAEAAAAGILPIVVAAGVRLARYERVRPNLEDVFLELVGTNGAARVAATEVAELGQAAAHEEQPSTEQVER